MAPARSDDVSLFGHFLILLSRDCVLTLSREIIHVYLPPSAHISSISSVLLSYWDFVFALPTFPLCREAYRELGSRTFLCPLFGGVANHLFAFSLNPRQRFSGVSDVLIGPQVPLYGVAPLKAAPFSEFFLSHRFCAHKCLFNCRTFLLWKLDKLKSAPFTTVAHFDPLFACWMTGLPRPLRTTQVCPRPLACPRAPFFWVPPFQVWSLFFCWDCLPCLEGLLLGSPVMLLFRLCR